MQWGRRKTVLASYRTNCWEHSLWKHSAMAGWIMLWFIKIKHLLNVQHSHLSPSSGSWRCYHCTTALFNNNSTCYITPCIRCFEYLWCVYCYYNLISFIQQGTERCISINEGQISCLFLGPAPAYGRHDCWPHTTAPWPGHHWGQVGVCVFYTVD